MKAYDTVLNSWIVEYVLFEVATNVENFLKEIMETWNTELTSLGGRLGV